MKLINADCLTELPKIPDKSIDAIITDIPYGTTACSWDTIIPFEPMWGQLKRIIKDNGAIVLFGSQPFTSALVMSNIKMFKYELIWEKCKASNYMLAKKQFMKYHENILVFYKNQPIYNPIKFETKPMNIVYRGGNFRKDSIRGKKTKEIRYIDFNRTDRFPKSIIKINEPIGNSKEKQLYYHPTQKPVALMKYLIQTYTNPGDTVLDFTMGSGTTGVAAKMLNRHFIGIEISPRYYEIAKTRIIKQTPPLF